MELFFDLVYVFAVTQLSGYLLQNRSAGGALKTGLLLAMVWLLWAYTTWVTNWLDPGRIPLRLLLLALMRAASRPGTPGSCCGPARWPWTWPAARSASPRRAGDNRVVTEDGYLLDNQQEEAGVRLGALAAIFDPWTFRHLDALGVGPGWRCWEVGAGGLSVPRWLAERAGPSGRVLATDIDTSWLADAADGAGGAGSAEVRRHDIAADEPPAEVFDLVHARLVLVHVADRDRALRSMISALRPGGWLLVEDADPALQPLICPDEYGPEQRLANKLRSGFRQLMAGRGADLSYGRRLPRLLRAAGLEEVTADGFFPVTSPACDVLEAATLRQISARLIAAGLATAAEIAAHLASVKAGRLDLATAPMISAWGHRAENGR
jgi:SAM-dependent methyltransferase